MNYTLKEIKTFYELMQKRKRRELKELILAVRVAVWAEKLPDEL